MSQQRPPAAGFDLAQEILTMVSLKRGVPVSMIVSSSRSRTIVSARHEAMRAIRKQTHMSYPEIGAIFNRHHVSVMAACKT